MGPGLVAGRVFGQQTRQADRLVTDFLANQLFAAGSFVAFVEKQVERLQNAVQPPRQLLPFGYLERNPRLANLLFRPCQPLGHRRLGRQKCPGDFRHTEAAEGIQGERDLRLRWNKRMAAHEHHPQTVVRKFLVGENRNVGRGALSLHQPDDFTFLVAEDFLAPDHIQRQVAGSPHNPRGRIFRNAVKRPGLQRSGQHFLDHVLGQGEVLDAENPRQGGDHLSRLMPEKMLHHLGHFLRWRLVAVKFRLAHGIFLFSICWTNRS